jgi:hypothetical protein
MKVIWVQTVASAVFVAWLAASAALAQEPAAAPSDQAAPQAPQPPAAQQFAPGQLDQMLAPIALYPDDLLGQVLMAAGYPLEVVEADRWLKDPANAALTGDQLAAALDQQSWDPSVKSLVAFPQVLNMLDGQLDWTESLGEAFINDPNAVMDAVQGLRRQAETAGKLRTNAQVVVTDQDGQITIEPANTQTVYVPDYEPSVVYGDWPYPDWPPYDFPDYWDDCTFDDFGYCWFGEPLILPLWGWYHWDWRHHHIDINRDRFTRLNGGHPPIGAGDTWEHDPAHRGNVPYQSPAARERFGGASNHPGAPAATRGYPTGAADNAPAISRMPPAFQSYGAGDDVRAQAERGESSRATMPSFGPSFGGFSHAGGFGGFSHSGGFGGFHGGGGGRR